MDKRISKTRDAIIDAYLELIFEKKEQKITISELAQRAQHRPQDLLPPL